MPFPKTPRTIYQENPLEEVICQLRFPPILKIETGNLVSFQDGVRFQFPFFETRLIENILPPELREVLPDEFVNALSRQARERIHDFRSEDSQWQLSLAKDFVSLSTRQYQRWTEFRKYFVDAIELLSQEYQPAFYIRVGLRYRNVIRRSRLNLTDTSWKELLQPQIAAPLNDDHIGEDEVTGAVHRLEFRLDDDGGRVRVIHGLTNLNDEVCYQIDTDLFTEERCKVDDAIGRLDYFNGRAGRIFRWCITDRLHGAMGPNQPEKT
ncbi:MAG TPA: TIGR04255 family protein [Caldilineaceae bacterium]|nr:TIGR04255 family protein [Caldilineaceae bacterium]